MARKKKKNSNSKPMSAWSKAELTMVKVTMIIVGIVFLLMSFFAIIFLPFAAVCFWLAYACIKEKKDRKAALEKEAERQRAKEAREAEFQREMEALKAGWQREREEKEAERQRARETKAAEEKKYTYLNFKVVGVTYKNGRKHRQTILRTYKHKDDEIVSIDFEQYLYEGRPAVYVKINDEIVGNVPKELIEDFLEMERLYKRVDVDCTIYGGTKKYDGSRTNYGCEITIKYFKGEA